LPRYNEALRLPAVCPGSLRCLRAPVPSLRSLFAPVGTSTTPTDQVLITGCPIRVRRRKRQDLPGSWGTPMRACPALRPRWDVSPRPSPSGWDDAEDATTPERCETSYVT